MVPWGTLRLASGLRAADAIRGSPRRDESTKFKHCTTVRQQCAKAACRKHPPSAEYSIRQGADGLYSLYTPYTQPIPPVACQASDVGKPVDYEETPGLPVQAPAHPPALGPSPPCVLAPVPTNTLQGYAGGWWSASATQHRPGMSCLPNPAAARQWTLQRRLGFLASPSAYRAAWASLAQSICVSRRWDRCATALSVCRWGGRSVVPYGPLTGWCPHMWSAGLASRHRQCRSARALSGPESTGSPCVPWESDLGSRRLSIRTISASNLPYNKLDLD